MCLTGSNVLGLTASHGMTFVVLHWWYFVRKLIRSLSLGIDCSENDTRWNAKSSYGLRASESTWKKFSSCSTWLLTTDHWCNRFSDSGKDDLEQIISDIRSYYYGNAHDIEGSLVNDLQHICANFIETSTNITHSGYTAAEWHVHVLTVIDDVKEDLNWWLRTISPNQTRRVIVL